MDAAGAGEARIGGVSTGKHGEGRAGRAHDLQDLRDVFGRADLDHASCSVAGGVEPVLLIVMVTQCLD